MNQKNEFRWADGAMVCAADGPTQLLDADPGGVDCRHGGRSWLWIGFGPLEYTSTITYAVLFQVSLCHLQSQLQCRQ